MQKHFMFESDLNIVIFKYSWMKKFPKCSLQNRCHETAIMPRADFKTMASNVVSHKHSVLLTEMEEGKKNPLGLRVKNGEKEGGKVKAGRVEKLTGRNKPVRCSAPCPCRLHGCDLLPCAPCCRRRSGTCFGLCSSVATFPTLCQSGNASESRLWDCAHPAKRPAGLSCGKREVSIEPKCE